MAYQGDKSSHGKMSKNRMDLAAKLLITKTVIDVCHPWLRKILEKISKSQ